jgi:hypothetical protein
LCDLFHTRELVTDRIHASVEEKVAMFLHVVGHNQRFRVVDLTFRRSIETINRFFHRVLYAVRELRNEFMAVEGGTPILRLVPPCPALVLH